MLCVICVIDNAVGTILAIVFGSLTGVFCYILCCALCIGAGIYCCCAKAKKRGSNGNHNHTSGGQSWQTQTQQMHPFNTQAMQPYNPDTKQGDAKQMEMMNAPPPPYLVQSAFPNAYGTAQSNYSLPVPVNKDASPPGMVHVEQLPKA